MQQPEDPSDIYALVGKLLGEHYRVVRVVGQGGMGVVYELRQVDIGRRAAAKLLKTHGVKDRRVVIERFVREAKVVASLNHTGIVTVWDLGWLDEQTPYIIMDYVEGRPFGAVLAEAARVDWKVAFDVVARACEPLQSAHAAGCTHRDLKPDNIIITTGGDVKVLDFGIAHVADAVRLTQTGFPVGTPLYMSREQIACAKDIDGRADIYSLGVVLYHAIAGRPIYEARNQFDLLRQMATSAPIDLGELVQLPDHVLWTIRKAMAADRADRFSTLQEFVAALRTSLGAGLGPLKASPDAKTAEQVVDFRSTPTKDERPAPQGPARTPSTPADRAAAMAAPATATRPNARHVRRVALVGGAVLCGLAVPVAITAALLSRKPVAPTVTPAVEAQPPAPAPKPPPRRWVRIVTLPSGATVERDGTRLGMTPLVVDHDGDRQEAVTVRLSLAGYGERVAEVLPRVDGGDAEFRLTRLRGASEPRPTRAPPERKAVIRAGDTWQTHLETKKMRYLTIMIAMLALPMMSGPAGAGELSKEARLKAKQHYEAAEKAFALGEFPRAIQEFKAAFEVSGEPYLLYNLGQTYRLAKDYEQALFFYKQFLARGNPARSEREVVQQKVGELENLVAAQRKTQQSPPTGTVKPPDVSPPVQPETPPAPAPPVSKAPTPPSPDSPGRGPRSASRPWYKNPAGWTLLAGGVALVAVGGGLFGAANGVDDSARTAATLPEQNNLLDSAATYRGAGYALAGVGAAAAVAGAIVLGVSARRSTRFNVGARFLPGGGMVALGGAW